MKYYIVIPTYNEEQFIGLTLQSLADQTVLPTKVIVVNDNSTDSTPEIVLAFAEKHPWISLVNKTSDAIHLPGSKVIQAFQKGLETLDNNYDLIVKVTGFVDEETGYLMDMKILSDIIKQKVLDRFDHMNLNVDVEEFVNLNPTAENIAMVIYNLIEPEIDPALELKILLYETERNYVEYPA